MKKALLTSAAHGPIAAPIAPVGRPVVIGVCMGDAGTAYVTVGDATFLLPDEQQALATALAALPGKDRAVTIAVAGMVTVPRRVIGAVLYFAQAGGFTEITVLDQPPAE